MVPLLLTTRGTICTVMSMIRGNDSQTRPTSHREIVSRWPSIAAFADDIGVAYETAKKMNQRSSIGRDYWLKVVEAAAKRGIDGISIELIARASAGVSA